METRDNKQTLIFSKKSIIELNDLQVSKVFGGTSLIIVTENTVKSIHIPTVNYSTNTLCTSDAK
jgi:hypothetical protein